MVSFVGGVIDVYYSFIKKYVSHIGYTFHELVYYFWVYYVIRLDVLWCFVCRYDDLFSFVYTQYQV